MRYLLLLVPCLFLGCNEEPVAPVKKSSTTASTPVAKKEAPKPVTNELPKEVKEEPAKQSPKRESEPGEASEPPPEATPPIPATFKPLNKTKTLFFEKMEDGTRRVHLLAEVVLREGPLEVFLCKFQTKEHESILNAEVDGREVHMALIAAGAEPGSPVKFVPQFAAAKGTKIKVTVQYNEKGKLKSSPAQEWIKDRKTNKAMAYDWVFAGSRFHKDPDTPNAPDYYMANNGELISVSNFSDSMLDLPIKSSKDAADLMFEINTPLIPPTKTKVIVTFEPVLEKK
jgi:hypothetical protein